MPAPRKYPKELIDRGVRLAIESGRPVKHVAQDIGLPSETLPKAVRQAEADQGLRDAPTTAEREEIRISSVRSLSCARPMRSCEPRRCFCQGARRDPTEVTAFIDQNRESFGVELICRTLEVSASAFYQRKTGVQSARQVEDERLAGRIRAVHAENYECYGYRRMTVALVRDGEQVGRDHVRRLMTENGLQGAKRRGKPWRTTTPDPAAQRAPDLLCRDFSAERPDTRWVGDFTYLRTWEGRVFFSFIIDVYSRMIVGW